MNRFNLVAPLKSDLMFDSDFYTMDQGLLDDHVRKSYGGQISFRATRSDGGIFSSLDRVGLFGFFQKY